MTIEPIGCERTSETDDGGQVLDPYAEWVVLIVRVPVADIDGGVWGSNDTKRREIVDPIRDQAAACIEIARAAGDIPGPG
tara:strand:- start:165 stop:404 length:240 start_codon:yes stop_codon:yes gene_type:complete